MYIQCTQRTSVSFVVVLHFIAMIYFRCDAGGSPRLELDQQRDLCPQQVSLQRGNVCTAEEISQHSRFTTPTSIAFHFQQHCTSDTFWEFRVHIQTLLHWVPVVNLFQWQRRIFHSWTIFLCNHINIHTQPTLNLTQDSLSKHLSIACSIQCSFWCQCGPSFLCYFTLWMYLWPFVARTWVLGIIVLLI